MFYKLQLCTNKAKRVFFIAFFLTLLYQSSTAQNKKIDSLKNVLKTEKEDTEKVNTLHRLSRMLYVRSDFSESTKYANEELSLAEKLNYKKGIADAYNNIGNIYLEQGNYTEALKNHQISLKIHEEIGYKSGIAASHNNLGYVDEFLGNFADAIKNYLSALKLYEELKDKVGISNCYDNIGNIYVDQGDYTQALKNLLLSLKMRKEIGDKYAIAASYNNIGDTYQKLGNYPEALKNHFESLKLNQEIANKDMIANSYHNIGSVYFDQGNYSEASKNFLAAIALWKEVENKDGMATAFTNLGKLNVRINEFSDARKYLDTGLALSKEIGNKEWIRDAYDGLSQLDSAIGDYKQALAYHKLYTDYKDSLLNETNSKQIAQAKEQYESEKKDKEILVQAADLNKQKQTKYYLIAGIFLLAVLSFFIYRTYYTRQKLKLLALRNKIASDLHDDIGSTLSSISIFSQMAQENSNEVKPMLQTIGESSRKMLDAMADIVWTINPENDQFEKIIMRMRSFAYELLGAKQIEFRFVADKNIADIKLSMEARRNLYLIFKEATNNMVKYADASRAMFSIKEDQGKLVMMIKDNGKGFDSNKESQGNGLKNMKKRADEMGAILMIDSIPGSGTTIKLEMAV